MKPRNTGYAARLILSGTLLLFIQACSTEIGGNEDNTKPVAVLTSLLGGEEVIGTHMITWDMQESNRSVIDLYISSDSGVSYRLMELDVADTGSFEWDSNTVDDCKTCRMRVIPRDVVGNIGDPSDSPADFEVNNIPNLFNNALFYDIDNNGIGDGDKIVVQFDKDVAVLTANVYDLFVLPVQGDFIGPSPFIRTTSDFSKLELVVNGAGSGELHLHVNGEFSKQLTRITSPSGLALREGIAGSIIAPDTGRSARPLSSIDISPAFSKQSPAAILGYGSNLTKAIAMADFDNDGDLDIVSVEDPGSDASNNGTYFLEQNTAGGFDVRIYANGRLIDGDVVTSIAIGDINNDGDIDMVIGLSNKGGNQIWNNQYIESVGLDEFEFPGGILGGNSTDAVALGDIDNDGDLDLITGNTDFANLVWINGGAGNFSHNSADPGHVLGNNLTVTRAVKLADIDNDNDLDILFGNDGSPDQVWFNEGNGSFTNSGQLLGNDVTYAIAVGDVDNDGDKDFVTGIINGANKLWLNDGSGMFTESKQSLGQANASRSRALLLVDIDNDRDLDLIVGDEDLPNRVWFNDGAGVFQDSGQSMGINATYALAVADMDNDGDLDLIEGNRGQVNQIWINPAATSPFTSIPQEESLNTTISIALGDLDGDGDLDLVEGNELQSDRVYFNDRSVFKDTYQSLAGMDTRKVLLGDVDKDNDLDMIIANATSILVYTNNGTGVFADSGQSLGNSDTKTAALGDVDDDGDLDLVTGNDSGTTLWLNTSGVFTDSGQSLNTNTTQDIAMTDLDNDGDLDLVLGTPSGIKTWINNVNNLLSEKGRFTALPVQSPDVTPTDDTILIAVGNIDGDNRPDLAYGELSSIATAINNPELIPDPANGPMPFETCSQRDVVEFCDQSNNVLSGFGAPQDMLLSDFNNDGEPDWVVAYNGQNMVLINNVYDFTKTKQGNNFRFPSFKLGGSDDTRAIAVGDIDNDGDIDIVEGNYGAANAVKLNDF